MIERIQEITLGNPGAIMFLKRLYINYPEELEDCIKVFEKYSIVGSKLYVFWNDCCSREWSIFFDTINTIKSGLVDNEELNACFSDPRPWHLV